MNPVRQSFALVTLLRARVGRYGGLALLREIPSATAALAPLRGL